MAKLLTDMQLELLIDNIMNKIKNNEQKKIQLPIKHPKLNITALKKAAENYLRERAKVMAIANDISNAGFSIGGYRDEPDNVVIADFDKWVDNVNNAYTRMKTKHRSDEELKRIRNTIKAELLRESLRVDDLNKALVTIEKLYSVA